MCELHLQPTPSTQHESVGYLTVPLPLPLLTQLDSLSRGHKIEGLRVKVKEHVERAIQQLVKISQDCVPETDFGRAHARLPTAALRTAIGPVACHSLPFGALQLTSPGLLRVQLNPILIVEYAPFEVLIRGAGGAELHLTLEPTSPTDDPLQPLRDLLPDVTFYCE